MVLATVDDRCRDEDVARFHEQGCCWPAETFSGVEQRQVEADMLPEEV